LQHEKSYLRIDICISTLYPYTLSSFSAAMTPALKGDPYFASYTGKNMPDRQSPAMHTGLIWLSTLWLWSLWARN